MRARWMAFGLAAAAACGARTELGAPSEPLQTQATCTAAIASSCRGLRVLTANAPFEGPTPSAKMVARNGGYEWFDEQAHQLSRLVLSGNPPLLHQEPAAPLDVTGIDGAFFDIATDGTHLFGCTRGLHNQLWAYDRSNTLTTMLDFPESADNPCSVAAFGNVALVTYDVFDAQHERAVLANDRGVVFSKESGANPYTGAYSCGLFTSSSGWAVSSVSIRTVPMDGAARHSFDLALAEPGSPTFARWPYDERSIAVVWRSADPNCNVHLVVVTDDGRTSIDRTFPSHCGGEVGPHGVWVPHVIAAGFGAVLDSGDGKLDLLRSDGDLVGAPVTLDLVTSSDPNQLAENDLWLAADDTHVVAIVAQFPGGPSFQVLQTILTCE